MTLRSKRAAPGLRRVYAPPSCFRDGELLLAGALLRQVRTVLRLEAGDAFSATDGAGNEYLLRLERAGAGEGRARVVDRTEPARESRLAVCLAQAVPKGDRFELVLQKAVELGVAAVVPLISERTVRAAGASGATAARWARIVEGAVAQCGRTLLPQLAAPQTFEQLLAAPGAAEMRILLWEQAARSLAGVVAGRVAPRSVLLAVGPEGSWSEAEVRQAEAAGFVAAHLGPRILRTETAGIAALAVVQSRWGDLGSESGGAPA